MPPSAIDLAPHEFGGFVRDLLVDNFFGRRISVAEINIMLCSRNWKDNRE